MAGAWSVQQCEEWDEFIDEVVQVGGRHELRIAKRNLERQVRCWPRTRRVPGAETREERPTDRGRPQDGDWVDPMFFAEDYTVCVRV
jgi:hypothetical protein